MRTQTGLESAVSLVIVDDNVGSLEMLASALAHRGLNIFTASDPRAALELIRTRHPDIVLTDLVMPGMSGLELLDRVMGFDPGIDVVLMTAHYTTESAVEAIKKGASDYLNKPVPIAMLRERIGRLVHNAQRRHRCFEIEDEMLATSEFEGIVGHSPLMTEMFSSIQKVAPHFRNLLVVGETGTGKELVARALHRLSPVADGKFVVLNCSAVVETLFESELFGHTKGAFTGATNDKPGLFEHASGGTLFLDEIGDMPLTTQAKLLRALQNQEILRVGSLVPRKVDTHVIAATNQDLRAAVAAKRFREDLYYRLSMVEIRAPRLEERKDDIPLLERHFVAKFSAQYGKPLRGLTHRAQIALAQHPWPGNVRELENAIGHAAMMVLGDIIDLQDLPEYLRFPAAPTHAIPSPTQLGALEDHEKQLVVHAMEAAGGNQSRAARILQIGRDALRYKLKKYHLQNGHAS
ncbi:MAG TPA: sigma-54 dependent transcriptional regulator [Bryobacteraceae bacterium]|nr:sigma-54 dependent transcriptional regulator [Bryobacteraceae bacterium]